MDNFNNLDQAIKQIDIDDEKYLFDTDATKYFNQDELNESSSISIITGPESGFSEKELSIINKGAFKLRFLGKNILRAETAPIVVSSLIKNHFGKINNE